jgi:ABC-type glycerol-3-phosphate transport system substrate-binding protein
MKSQFDWHVGEVEEEAEEQIRDSHPGWWSGSFWFLVAAAFITSFLVIGWRVGQAQLANSEGRLTKRAQTILDLEHEAFLNGDGDLFFSVQTNDPAWLAAQLLPENQAANWAGLEVTRARSHGDFVWANVAWDAGDENWQRVAFFEWQNNQLVHVPGDSAYWGERQQSQRSWGTLVYHDVDNTWAAGIATFVTDLVDRYCADGCPTGKRPFTLVIASDYAKTAAPNEIRIPSPRLIALKDDGRPALLFWQLLQRKIKAHFTPAAIRFAVPPPDVRDGTVLTNYAKLASDFMADHPDITIEVVRLDELPDDLGTLAEVYDGVAIPPTESMLAAGLVHDLTDFINTDPDFDGADFYEQVWQGAGWRGRTWFMPQAASMRVIFYDKEAYRWADLAEPSLRWTWEEMGRDVARIVSAQPENGALNWGFLDIDLDSFLSYAYNWNNQCLETATVRCQNPLRTENVAAAIEWYRQLSGQPGGMPDLTGQTLFDRQFVQTNWQTTYREAAIWVDRAANYEHQLLLANLGVVPFPGSDRFDGITPLWVQGNFISQLSDRPLAVWQWLKFLSYQRPSPRLIPARPSVADAVEYWRILPRPLGNVMRTAFPFARPVTIEERAFLSWQQVSTMMDQDLPAM